MKSWIIFFFLPFSGMIFSQNDNSPMYLQYENYERISFPIEELKKHFGEEIRFFVNDTIGKYSIYPGICIDSTAPLYSYLLKKDVVSGYVDIYEKEGRPRDKYYVSREKYLGELRKSLKMYYIGKVMDSVFFDKYIFTTYDNTSNSRRKKEIMINIKDGKLCSIVELSYYNFSDYGNRQYTIYLGDENYQHGVKTLYSDVVGEKAQEENSIEFHINNKGFIIVKD